MTHKLACLLHYIACNNGEPVMLANHPTLCEAMPEALRLGLIRSPDGCGRVALDQFWAELTERGRQAVDEGLCSMNEVA